MNPSTSNVTVWGTPRFVDTRNAPLQVSSCAPDTLQKRFERQVQAGNDFFAECHAALLFRPDFSKFEDNANNRAAYDALVSSAFQHYMSVRKHDRPRARQFWHCFFR